MFPHGRVVYRLRAAPVVDPYSGDVVASDWSAPTVIPIAGFVAHTSTSMLATSTRAQASEAKSLFCGDVDVAKGDRILDGVFDPPLPSGSSSFPSGTVMVGPLYTIDGIPPEADVNPWTGWTPPREIPLTRYVG